jgi:hypothetical protein
MIRSMLSPKLARSAAHLWLVPLATAVSIAVAPSAALAEQARLFAGTFGSATSTVVDPYPLARLEQVAVDGSTHDIYATDPYGHRVEKFDSEGHFLFMFGLRVNKTAVEESGSRPEPEQDVCPAVGHPADVCQGGTVENSSDPTPLEQPVQISVDDSKGPSEGDVYVGNGLNVYPEPAGIVEKFDSSGRVIESWEAGGKLNGSAVTDPPARIAGPFGRIEGLAVDPGGNLWVSAAYGNYFEFGQAGNFIEGWKGNSGQEIAIGPEGNVYTDSYGSVLKYSSIGKFIGQIAPSKAEYTELASQEVIRIRGLAVDESTGDLFLDGGELTGPKARGVIKRYDSSCQPVITNESPPPGCAAAETFGAGFISEEAGSAAIDFDSASDPLYIADTQRNDIAAFPVETVPSVVTSPPASPTATSATLTGSVNPSGIELNAGTVGCRFEWGATAAPYEHTAPCDKTSSQIGNGSTPVEVRATITGLQAGTTYHYRLVVSNANDVNASIEQPSLGKDIAFGPPVIESASALSVTTVGAVLQAQVDPNDLDTQVRIEYGLQAGAYTQSVAGLDVGSAGVGQAVNFELSGLVPVTTYHYRVIAENVLGQGGEAVTGQDLTFTTQVPGSFSLLDGRGWELVSPANKRGAQIEPLGSEGLVQASADGDAISYVADAPTEAVPAGNASSWVQVLSARSARGWSSLDLATSHNEPVGTPAGPGPEYKFFSPDLLVSIVEPVGAFDPLSAEASEKTPYLRTDFPAGDPSAICTVSCYRPLITGMPGFENVPAGTEFGEEATECSGRFCGPQFLGASLDASHIVLQSNVALVEGAPVGSLYEWYGGQLQLVSVLPGAGGPAPAGSGPQQLGSRDGKVTRDAISDDGSRVVWSERTGSHHLYLRDLSREETLRLDINKGGSGKGNSEPVFQGASSDGSVVIFTDEQQLTADSGATVEKPDLYRCQAIVGESSELECALTDLTPAGGAESADVRGPIAGVSDDGSFVYFFADGVLAHNQVNNGAGMQEAAPGDCVAHPAFDTPDERGCNLYVSHSGVTTFIASLPAAAYYDWYESLANQPLRVSPEGEWLAFVSERPLTSYDSRDALTGRPVAEVYLYHAATGKIVCASCDPTGARPHGVEYLKVENSIVSGYQASWRTNGLVAAMIAGSTNINEVVPGYQDRNLSDSGRLFFNSLDALIPQDSNGGFDVYEYEPSGVGSCSESNATFSGHVGGCTDLVSSGTSGEESVFLDASANGDDVFFLTAAQLSYRDTDSAYDVYDARVGGGESEPVKPIECQGDACQSFVAAPNDPTPDSLTFQGPGNIVLQQASSVQAPVRVVKKATKCAKGKKRTRGKCVKVKRKRVKAKKASRGWGARR